MRNLIISKGHYDWIPFCFGTIKQEGNFEVFVLLKELQQQAHNYPDLCSSAVYEQRKCDLMYVCKVLGIKKLSNLGVVDDIDYDGLVVTVELKILLEGVKVVYVPFDTVLYHILKEMERHINVIILGYGNVVGTKVIDLSEEEFELKKNSWGKMLAVPETMCIYTISRKETFC